MDTNSKIDTEPLVSIIMLTYNRSKFILEAVNSVRKQTHKNWKLIIIDDGSTDNTHEIIEDLKEERIRYIRHDKNAGLITRRKESLNYAEGLFVAILDSDDIWISENKLTEQVQYMKDNSQCSLIGTNIILIDDTNIETGKDHYETDDLNIRENILRRNQFTHSSVLIRASALSKTVGYRNTTLAEDYDLFLQLGQYGTFANLPKYYTSYRIHNNSENHKRLLMALSVLNIVKTYKNKYPNYYLSLTKCYLRIAYTWIRQKIK